MNKKTIKNIPTKVVALLTHFILWVPIGISEANGLWKSMPPAPTARTEASVTIVKDKIFVIGGFTPKGISGKVEMLNLSTGKWSKRASLPYPLHHLTASTVNEKIYAIGGFKTGFWTPVAHTFEYDLTQDKWTKKRPMPTPRGALASVVVNSKIHLIGGANKPFFRLVNTSAHELYDPATNSWKTLSPLPTPRDHLGIAEMNGIIYVIGGRIDVDYKHNLSHNEAYNTKTKKWSRKSDLPTARSGITTQTFKGRVFVIGGESEKKTFIENEAYDPTTNTWETMEPMSKGLHGLGSAVYKNNIHLLTGGANPGGGGSKLHEVFSISR